MIPESHSIAEQQAEGNNNGSNGSNGSNRSATSALEYQSLKLVATRRAYSSVALVLVVFLVLVAAILIFVPWQQSVSGNGKTIIFSPMDRPQNIESQIPARIKAWHVQDGQQVRKGQLIVELEDLDPRFLDPRQVERLQQQRQALSARKAAAELRYQALSKQIQDLHQSQKAALPSATERTYQARDGITAAEQMLMAARQNADTTDLNLKRLQNLFEKGLRSKRDLELAQLDHARAVTEAERAVAALEIARRDRTIAVYDQHRIAADTGAAINAARAAMAAARETVESTASEIFKLDVELQNVSRRMELSNVLAPSAGRIVRLLRVGAGETVSAGAVLAVLAPDTEDLAAELLISDWDAPLVAVGRPVRLQFAGWPALQFTGWPSIAVGTFAGRVAVIDAVDDGRNNYRVLVRPDVAAIAAGKEEPWPAAEFLRPGAATTGWIMLDTVPLGFELWRQFNAFPPTIDPESLGLSREMDGSNRTPQIKRKAK